MKKTFILLATGVMALGLTSCARQHYDGKSAPMPGDQHAGYQSGSSSKLGSNHHYKKNEW